MYLQGNSADMASQVLAVSQGQPANGLKYRFYGLRLPSADFEAEQPRNFTISLKGASPTTAST